MDRAKVALPLRQHHTNIRRVLFKSQSSCSMMLVLRDQDDQCDVAFIPAAYHLEQLPILLQQPPSSQLSSASCPEFAQSERLLCDSALFRQTKTANNACQQHHQKMASPVWDQVQTYNPHRCTQGHCKHA